MPIKEFSTGSISAYWISTATWAPEIIKDEALERRFQKAQVDEPSTEDTIAILRGLKKKYEFHHGVDITVSAKVAATTLSQRYITDRQLHDKAIDLVDKAAWRLRVEIDSMPESFNLAVPFRWMWWM